MASSFCGGGPSFATARALPRPCCSKPYLQPLPRSGLGPHPRDCCAHARGSRPSACRSADRGSKRQLRPALRNAGLHIFRLGPGRGGLPFLCGPELVHQLPVVAQRDDAAIVLGSDDRSLNGFFCKVHRCSQRVRAQRNTIRSARSAHASLRRQGFPGSRLSQSGYGHTVLTMYCTVQYVASD